VCGFTKIVWFVGWREVGREEMAEEVEDFEEDFGSRMIGTRLADDTKNQYEQKVKNLKGESAYNSRFRQLRNATQLPGNCTRKIVSKLNQMRPRRSETSSFAISAKLPNENDVWERTQ
jgi:hypothetical protein